MLDAGIGPRRATERMRALGSDLVTARSALGIFVTHEHGDHAAHAQPLAKALHAPVYIHAGIALPRPGRRLEVRAYEPGKAVRLGPFVVESLALPHDAPHVALRVSAAGRRVALATDLGHATRALRDFLAESDLVFLEANYCPRMLEDGPRTRRASRAAWAGPPRAPRQTSRRPRWRRGSRTRGSRGSCSRTCRARTTRPSGRARWSRRGCGGCRWTCCHARGVAGVRGAGGGGWRRAEQLGLPF